MATIREIAENLAHDISNPFDDGKPVVEVAIKEMALAALREFGEELAKICDERGEICKQIAAGGATDNFSLIFMGRAEECQERARAIRAAIGER